jgi:hypothetical protein
LTPVWVFGVGLLLYYLVGIIPIIDILVKIVALLAGTGAIVLQKKNSFVTLRAKKLL